MAKSQPPTPSTAALACPTCGFPRSVPEGSREAYCRRCEPELLWDAAKRAWEATHPQPA